MSHQQYSDYSAKPLLWCSSIDRIRLGSREPAHGKLRVSEIAESKSKLLQISVVWLTLY